MKIQHLIEIQQFKSPEMLENIFQLTDRMEEGELSGNFEGLLLSNHPRKKILASLFYEPSTRTRLSFESAMKRLNGEVLTTEHALQFSSVTKGETLVDTIRVVGSYADLIVLRHYEEGAAKQAAEISPIPIINAGDGCGQHPTQALLDMYTIKKELGRIKNLNVAFVGDLLYGRTVHSLAYLLARQEGIRMYLVSPEQIRMPRDILNYLDEHHILYEETSEIEEWISSIDILYVTRIQKERFRNVFEYQQVEKTYTINNELVSRMKEDARIMHPLPRVGEISMEVDSDPRAAYFKQAQNGLFLRMALLKLLLDAKEE